MIKLKQIDLKKSHENECPGIKADCKTPYLIRYGGHWFAGTFSKVWFGISFDGWYAPLQFDEPGTNASEWQAVYEICSGRKK